jgi:hypothetical protein
VKKRGDTTLRHLKKRFKEWLTGTNTLTDIAHHYDRTRRQMVRLFEPLWHMSAPQPPQTTPQGIVLIVDGVYLSGRRNAVLIGRSIENVVFWLFADQECYVSWCMFFSAIQTPRVIVMDGQKGLSGAVKTYFPHVPIQRCLVHVERYVRSRISMRPKTEAGRALWSITRSLWNVTTQEDATEWSNTFTAWCQTYDSFLKERTHALHSNRWWYTHRGLRSARSHLKNALPHLFTFTVVKDTPRTSNHIEGGTNARLKE